jgi:hypothetical protein
MLHYKFKKTEYGTIVHIILEDNWDILAPSPRPPTENEIQAIMKRERHKKIQAILKEYNERRQTKT